MGAQEDIDLYRKGLKVLAAWNKAMQMGWDALRRDQLRKLRATDDFTRWSREERHEAEVLLLHYMRLRKRTNQAFADQWLVAYLKVEFERFLRIQDMLNQRACKAKPPGRAVKLHLDPCAPGFRSSARGHWRAGWAETELSQFHNRIRRRVKWHRGSIEDAHRLIAICYAEFWLVASPEGIRRRIRGELMLEGVLETVLSALPLAGRAGTLRSASIARARSALRRLLKLERQNFTPKSIRVVRGKFGEPPHINGYIRVERQQVVVELKSIIKYRSGPNGRVGPKDAATASMLRGSIVRAAKEAAALGHKSFTLIGRQGNQNFRNFANTLNRNVGVGKGVEESGGVPGLPDVKVELSVGKVKASNRTLWRKTDLNAPRVGP